MFGDLLAAAFGGGLVVKLLDIAYQEILRRSDRSRSARRFVERHIDPLLKSADEVVGKVRSLAEQDFKSLRDAPTDDLLANKDLANLLYLFANFWAQIEIFRHEGLSVPLVEDERGKRLQSFMDCLESRRVRIVDRISQRAVGELMLTERNGRMDTLRFIEFARMLETDQEARQWIMPLATVLARTRHKTARQQILQYGVVTHAMVDSLDAEHHVTRERPSYPNKLSKRSLRDLRHRVFGVYLTFVRDTDKYLRPPRRGGRPKK